MLKKAFYVLIPLATVLTPVAYYSAPGWWSGLTASLSLGNSTEAPNPDPAALAPSPGGAGSVAVAPATPPLEGVEVHDLTEVLRFDVKPGWIVSRWPRVSAGLGQLQLQGYRVPLVTGTAQDDLAGALTYYFDPRQEVQRITFNGTTGDTQKLVHLMTTRYGFARRLANDPGLFVYEIPGSDGGVQGTLQIRPARVVKSSDPYRRFDVWLAILRPEPG